MRPWLSLVLTGCSGALPGPSLLTSQDVDGDGWAPSDGDCDDSDPDVNPHAVDRPDDEIDQDCDGADDLALGMRGVVAGDLVISEVMVDPVGVPSGLGEWFEIHNTTDVDIDLNGLVALDRGGDDFVVGTSVIVRSEQYVVLGIWDIEAENGGVVVDYRYESDYGLSNAEDAIRLVFDGVLLDEVAWDARFPVESGYAMTLAADVDAAGNDDPAAWCLAPSDAVYGIGGRGSPGAQNDACPEPFTGLGVADLQYGDLVITEVMQNPARVEDDLGEWLEVANRTGFDVDLRGLTVGDGYGEAFDVYDTLVVPADGRVVFGSFADTGVNGGVPVDWEWRWSFGLANSGQRIDLRYGTRLIDSIEYDNGLTFPDPSGASMVLSGDVIDADSNDLGPLWCQAVEAYGDGDLGSPGEPNPVCVEALQGTELQPGDLVITEIMKDPQAVDGDIGEWFEVHNRTAEVVDLAGVTVRDDGGESHLITDSLRVDPGGFAVLGQEQDTDDNGGAPVDYAYGSDLRLGNADDEIVLEFSGTVLDAISYDDLAFPDAPGASLSLDPSALNAVSNDVGGNWCAATLPYGDGDLGTPGSANPGC